MAGHTLKDQTYMSPRAEVDKDVKSGEENTFVV